MFQLIEVVVEDKEFNRRIVVASFKKEISLLDCFPKDIANELFKFLSKKSGKLMGKPKRNFRDMNFFPRLLNEKPFELLIRKVNKR